MNDLINRQAAIDEIKALYEWHDTVTEDRAVDHLKRLPSVQQWCEYWDNESNFCALNKPPAQLEPRWIPCDKGEPDEDMECWITIKTTDALYRGNFTKRYGERRDKGFITSGGFMWWNIAIAWMPIYEPEPWKGETDDTD